MLALMQEQGGQLAQCGLPRRYLRRQVLRLHPQRKADLAEKEGGSGVLKTGLELDGGLRREALARLFLRSLWDRESPCRVRGQVLFYI